MTEHAETRWLTAREQEIWRSYMTASIEFQAQLDRQLRAEAGMPVAYYEILVILSESPGHSMRMSRVAGLCNSSSSRLSHAIAAMEASGWVTRRAIPGDRRGSLAKLTDAGHDALKKAASGHVTQVREILFDALTAAQLDALDALDEISQTLSARLMQATRASQ
jgi:DNA-binding MarR family transcriptional regulator